MRTKNLKVLAEHVDSPDRAMLVGNCNDHELYLRVVEQTRDPILQFTHSEVLYLVLSGHPLLRTGPEQQQTLKPWDFVRVERGHPYQWEFEDSCHILRFLRCDQDPVLLRQFDQNREPEINNVYDEYRKYHEDHHNIQLALVNNHQFRLGINKGEYPEHHHPNSDELFLFVQGEFHLAHILGEDNFTPLDLVHMKKYEFHKPFVPERSLMLYFEHKDIRTVTYEGADYSYFTDA